MTYRLKRSSPRTLVVIPCGSAKIWDRDPDHGATPAAQAYIGTPFRLNRQYAERFGDHWLILSAKYGLIAPEFSIPAPYDTTFKRRSTNPVSIERLREQAAELPINTIDTVVGLGGKEYRAALQAAFDGLPVSLIFPFAGLQIGETMQAVRRALDNNLTP